MKSSVATVQPAVHDDLMRFMNSGVNTVRKSQASSSRVHVEIDRGYFASTQVYASGSSLSQNTAQVTQFYEAFE